jgi:hypothetical protein
VDSVALRWVRQEEPNGCVAATLAMMLGTDYWSAAAMLRPHADCYSSIALQEVLYDHGWAKCPIGRKRADGSEREQYPPEPFAPVHRISVKFSKDSGLYHSILWMRDGSILDPMTPEPRTLSDYAHIGCIEGWVNLPSLDAASPNMDREDNHATSNRG